MDYCISLYHDNDSTKTLQLDDMAGKGYVYLQGVLWTNFHGYVVAKTFGSSPYYQPDIRYTCIYRQELDRKKQARMGLGDGDWARAQLGLEMFPSLEM